MKHLFIFNFFILSPQSGSSSRLSFSGILICKSKNYRIEYPPIYVMYHQVSVQVCLETKVWMWQVAFGTVRLNGCTLLLELQFQTICTQRNFIPAILCHLFMRVMNNYFCVSLGIFQCIIQQDALCQINVLHKNIFIDLYIRNKKKIPK